MRVVVLGEAPVQLGVLVYPSGGSLVRMLVLMCMRVGMRGAVGMAVRVRVQVAVRSTRSGRLVGLRMAVRRGIRAAKEASRFMGRKIRDHLRPRHKDMGGVFEAMRAHH